MIRKAKRLRVISRTGGGMSNVDIDAATECGIVACGVKGPQDRLVAEHAMAAICALSKTFYYLDPATRSGNFKSRYEYKPQGLSGKQLGIIGLGRIGRILAAIAMNGFNMRITGYDPYVGKHELAGSGIVVTDSLDNVIQTADFLSLHVPLISETEHLLNKERLTLMKPTAYVINTSRGGVVDEDALADALVQKTIAGAGIDVFENEPPEKGNRLFALPNVIVTPHSAALTKEIVAELAAGAAENALRALEGKKPSYSPNWQALTKPHNKL
jgi:D-3-phosphoglycerate dehydrogenase